MICLQAGDWAAFSTPTSSSLSTPAAAPWHAPSMGTRVQFTSPPKTLRPPSEADLAAVANGESLQLLETWQGSFTGSKLVKAGMLSHVCCAHTGVRSLLAVPDSGSLGLIRRTHAAATIQQQICQQQTIAGQQAPLTACRRAAESFALCLTSHCACRSAGAGWQQWCAGPCGVFSWLPAAGACYWSPHPVCRAALRSAQPGRSQAPAAHPQRVCCRPGQAGHC